MRSRTEARWAALFDVMGIEWEYEPIDLAGYIPDFTFSMGGREYLVEVKSTDEDFVAAETKIECSGWEGPALIVGHAIDGSCCGRFRDFGEILTFRTRGLLRATSFSGGREGNGIREDL